MMVAPTHQAPTLIGCSIVKERLAPAHVALQMRKSSKEGRLSNQGNLMSRQAARQLQGRARPALADHP
jgi:hypothetical protein